MNQPPVIHLEWRHLVAYTNTPIRDILPLALVGMGFAALSLIIGYPLMSITFIGVSAIAFLSHLSPRLGIKLEADGVSMRQQPPWRNAVVLLPLIFAVMASATLAQVFVGANEVDLRLLLIAIALCCIAILLGVIAFRTSGPVRISGTTVTFPHGVQFLIERDSFVVETTPRGPPVLKFTGGVGTKSSAARLTKGQYGTDAETVAATLEQLRIWMSHGRIGTTVEIAAMLAIEPPTGLGVGDSVVVEVPVQNAAGGNESD